MSRQYNPVFTFVACVIFAVACIAAFLWDMHPIRDLSRWQSWIALALLLAGALFASIKPEIPKLAFAVMQLTAASISNFYQIGKILEGGTKTQFYDRLIFIIAGVAVTAAAFEAIFKAEDEE
jgi:hypothetical protein